jgi:hypothetical protein
MVIVYVPAAVVEVVLITSPVVPEPVIEGSTKRAVAPDGTPATLRVSTPLNPPNAEVVMVKVLLVPRNSIAEAGETEMLKSG